MQASFFCTNGYLSREAFRHSGWPTRPALYRSEIGLQSLQAALAQAELADEVGFDWVSCSEHHYTPLLQTPNAAVFAGALSQVVKRAKIAVLGPSLPTLNPVRVAEEFAMLDAMTGGRLIAGLMRGTPNEYVTYNFNPSESRARFAEALEIIRRAWTEPGPFPYEGRHYPLRYVNPWPLPSQRPHPPIWIGGGGEQKTLRVVAQHADGWNAFPAPVQQLRHKLDVLRGHCDALGRDYNAIRKQLVCTAIVRSDPAQVEEEVARFAEERQVPPERARQMAIAGTPEQVAAALTPYIGIGFDMFLLMERSPLDHETLRLFMHDVAPRMASRPM